MTLTTTTNVAVSQGNGVADEFEFSFRVLDEAHLVVTRQIRETGIVDKTYLSSEYTVTGIGTNAGSITLVDGPLSAEHDIVITRTVPYTQELDIVNQGGFLPETVEEQLDLTMMGVQQLASLVDEIPEIDISAQASAASAAAAEAAISATVAEAAAVDADASADAALLSEVASDASADLAATYATAAAAYSNGYLFDTAAEGVSQGVISLTIGAAGSSGANGQFALAFSGGGGSGAAGTFNVSGGAVTEVNLTRRGKSYSGNPTVSVAASSGLSGATVTATRGNYAVPDGEYYLVKGSGNIWASLYKNVGGVATSQNLSFPSLAALSVNAARSLAQYGYYEETFGDNTSPTTINLTDGAGITFTPTNNADNIEIDQVTGARTVLYSTLNVAGTEQRITLHCNITAAASAGNGVGICFYGGAGDYTAFYYQANGWFRQHDQSGLSSLSLGLDAWSGATTVDYVIDIFSDGTARMSVMLNDGKTWHFGGLASVPLSAIKLVVADTMTVEFSMTQASIPAYVSTELANIIAAPASTAYEGLLGALELTPPTGFDSAITDAVSVYRFDSTRAFTSLSLHSELAVYDPQVSTIYVDVASGNDSNPGTAAAPIKRLSTALARGIGGKLKIIANGGLYNGLNGFNQTVITAIDHLEVVSGDGEKIISSCHETISWSLDTGTTYSGIHTNVFYSIFDAATIDANGDYLRLADAGTLPACRTTVGSYYKTGTTLYVNLGRAPDADLRVFTGVGGSGTGQFYYKKAGGTVYLEDVEIHGGYQAAYILVETAGTTTVSTRRCSFKYGGANGFYNQGNVLASSQESICSFNMEDGFVYHHYSTLLGIPKGIEVDCIARSNGWNATGTNNGSTTHDGGHMLRVNGLYEDNQNRQIHDVNDSLTWMVGCVVTDPRAGAYSNYCAGVGGGAASIMHLDGCESSGTYDLETIITGSTIYTTNFTSDGTNVSGANVLPYTP